MASKYSSAEIVEFQANAKVLETWDGKNANADFIAHCRKSVMIVIDKELTEKMKTVYTMYYFDGLSVSKIAAILGVNKSTVSISLKRANARLARVMRYSAPHLLHANAARRNKRMVGGDFV